jgi:plasmid stabilization system protein ParE
VDQALKWSDAIYDQIESLAEFPESHALSVENDDFPYEIRDKLVGLGRRRRYRAVFAIQEDRVLVLAVRAVEEDRLAPDDVEFDADVE